MKNMIYDIHGITVDRDRNRHEVFLRENEPRLKHPKILGLLESGKLDKAFPNGYLVYMHKTPEVLTSAVILSAGININDKCGNIDSSMTKVYDSKSKHPEGDENYLFNSINEPNAYGTETILAVFGREENEDNISYPACVSELEETQVVSPRHLLGYVSYHGDFFAGRLMRELTTFEEQDPAQ